MKDKNKFTLKIVLVIALAVALIATLISCCVLATKGKLTTQASCDNNQTAFVNERPDLDCCATASGSNDSSFNPLDYCVSLSQCNTTDTYYGFYITESFWNSIINYNFSNNMLSFCLFTFTGSTSETMLIGGGFNDVNYIGLFDNMKTSKIYENIMNYSCFSPYVVYPQGFMFTDIVGDIPSDTDWSTSLKVFNKFPYDNSFCTFETVVGGTYIINGLPDIGFSSSANGVFSRRPFANGQKGKIHNTLYLDWDLIRPNGGLHEGEKVSFKNTFYIYDKNNETVTFNGLLDFVEYSIRNFDNVKGYPILMTGKEDSGDNITFRLVDYNVNAMKEVVISDRTYKAGYDRGHANGISEATQNGHIFESSTSFLKSIFTDLGQLLDIKVFGNITVGTLIGIPLILLVVMAVLKLVRG